MDALPIPHTIEPRGDTRVNNVTLGMWLFLASEVMLFGALFSAYALLRVAAPQWPHGPSVLNVTAGVANTVVLLAGAFGVWRARAGGPARRWLWLGVAAAVVFLAIKSLEWTHEIGLGLVPSANTFLATYYTLTGLHAAHVAGGLIANLCVLGAARRAGEATTANRIHALSLYWTFIDLVWLAILATMYLS